MHGFRKPRYRFDGLEDHHVIIRRLDGLDRVGNVKQFGILGVFHALEGKLHVGGRKLVAVMKFDALAQLEFPGHIVEPFPLRSQGRGQFALRGLALKQAIEEVGHIGKVGIRGIRMRIHRFGRGVRGHHQVRFGQGHRGQGQHQGRHQGH